MNENGNPAPSAAGNDRPALLPCPPCSLRRLPGLPHLPSLPPLPCQPCWMSTNTLMFATGLRPTEQRPRRSLVDPS